MKLKPIKIASQTLNYNTVYILYYVIINFWTCMTIIHVHVIEREILAGITNH